MMACRSNLQPALFNGRRSGLMIHYHSTSGRQTIDRIIYESLSLNEFRSHSGSPRSENDIMMQLEGNALLYTVSLDRYIKLLTNHLPFVCTLTGDIACMSWIPTHRLGQWTYGRSVAKLSLVLAVKLEVDIARTRQRKCIRQNL